MYENLFDTVMTKKKIKKNKFDQAALILRFCYFL